MILIVVAAFSLMGDTVCYFTHFDNKTSVITLSSGAPVY